MVIGYKRQKKFDLAINCFEQATKMDPQFHTARQHLSYLEASQDLKEGFEGDGDFADLDIEMTDTQPQFDLPNEDKTAELAQEMDFTTHLGFEEWDPFS